MGVQNKKTREGPPFLGFFRPSDRYALAYALFNRFNQYSINKPDDAGCLSFQCQIKLGVVGDTLNRSIIHHSVGDMLQSPNY